MKNNTRKILLAFLVVFTLLMSMATVTAFAEETSTDDDVTIYFENNWLWTDVRCYYWGDGVTCAEFPGESMELYGSYDGHEVYSYNVPAGITGLIISGFKDTAPTERDKTPDITTGIVDGVAWRMQWDGGNWVESFDYDPSNPNQGGSTGGSTGEGTTYTVAGFAGLCYSDWNPADNYNDMTLNPETGLYEKTFTGITADYYECKVAANHSWTQSWGGSAGEHGNYSFTTFEEHDITITFDPATGTVGHVLADSTGAAEERPQPEKPDIDYEDTIIVYLSNSANWETPFVYFWTSGSSDQNASWPGQEMEWDGEKMLFYVVVPKYYKYIIFNNGSSGEGNQTADLEVPQQENQFYDNGSSSWDDVKNYIPPVPPEDTTEDVTVYVKDDAGWGQVYIHFWSTTGIEATTFPGTPMEKDENGYWVFTIPAENYGVLFTNGVNWDQPGAAQTCDLLIPTNGKVYISNANSCLYDDGIGNDNDAWYSVGGNSGNTDNDNGNTGNNGGNTGDNTPDVPSNDKPATEMTFLQKLALKLLLFLRSIEDMFAGFFKK